MEAPQPINFLGFPFDVWVTIITAALALYACVVLARRKRRSFSELGDGEQDGPDLAAGERPFSEPGAASSASDKTPHQP